MTSNDIRIAVSAVCMLAASLGAPSALAGFKCWTNSEGVRECGNAVPPEYAQQGHREMTDQGLTVKTTTRAPTKEELREEREERERQEALAAEQERQRKAQAAKDRVLLSTFSTEEDLLLARNGKIAALESRIQHTEAILFQLEKNLNQFLDEAAKLERGGKQVTPELRTNIANLQKQIEDSHVYIYERRQKMAEVETKFQEDLARYRELKGTN